MAKTKRYSTRKTDLDTGIVVQEKYWRSGKLHRDPTEGPALIQRNPKTGICVAEEYWVDGRRHRLDGPALIWRNGRTGKLTAEHYSVHGHLHREGGPAFIQYDERTGELYHIAYFIEGTPNRYDDGPVATYWKGHDPTVVSEYDWSGGKYVQRPERRIARRPTKIGNCDLG